MMLYVILLGIGLLGGFIAGLIGVGGGLIYILFLPPILLQIGIPQAEIAQYTIANSILGTFFAAGFSTYNHYKKGEFYPRAVLTIAVFGIMSSILSLRFLVNTPLYSQEVFNLAVIVLLFIMLINTFLNAKKQMKFAEKTSGTSSIYATTGSLAGLVASLTGLGGGIIIVPVVNQWIKTGVRKAKTISLAVITITSLLMVVYNMLEETRINHEVAHLGYIIFQVTLPIAAGAIISAGFGVRLSRKLPQHIISYAFASFVLIVILRKVFEIII